jgi:cytochrome c553
MKTPPSILPASIGGQPVRYLTSQLLAFKAGTRRNDEGSVMRNLARNMTSDEIESVATYIGGLR